ncbi:MAG: FecR domain-containing protein [Pseudomonadota bacterium]
MAVSTPLSRSAAKAAIRRAAHDWRARLDREDITPAQLRAFEAWLAADIAHQLAYDRAVTLWASTRALTRQDLDHDVLAPMASERLRDAFASFKAVVARRSVQAVCAGVAIAMAVPVLGLIDFSIRPPASRAHSAEYASQIGEVRTFKLADGSAVTLGASSQIKVQISAGRRDIELVQGAALFDVAHDAQRPFSVRAGALTATALGTVFDVRANGDVVRVGVREGQVAVDYPLIIDGVPSGTKTRRKLNAGRQLAAFKDHGITPIRTVSAASIGVWRNGRLLYDGASLAELLADAQRYAQINIVLDGDFSHLAQARVSAAFDASDVAGMLSALPDILPIELMRRTPNEVVIMPR